MICKKWAVIAGWVAMLLALLPLYATHAQSSEHCFAETSYCISGRIRTFWEQNGGLAVFGLPITPQQQETIDGRPLQVQWFERNRLELHPENQPPYDVLLGRLGADRLAQQGRDWRSFSQSIAQPNCRFFAATGHNICGDILTAWHAHGLEIDGRSGKTEAENMALFGLPLSDAQTETLSDGKKYTVQWFERARFELHPENQPPYNVLLGLLGKEIGPTVSNTPAQPTGCASVQQIDLNSAQGRQIAIDFLPTLEYKAINPKFSIIDSLNGWGIFTFKADDYEKGYILMRPLPNGHYQVAATWGGIAPNGVKDIRNYFVNNAPDVPQTLVNCWEPRQI